MTTPKTRQSAKLGYQEFALLPDDGQRHEVINGEHFVNPAPGTHHQRLSIAIAFQLFAQITAKGLGQVFTAPTDLQLSDHDIVQPDLMVQDRSATITPTRIQGAPNLIIEILSATTAALDRRRKKELYCRAQVPEYWIVNPDQREVEQFILRTDEYELIGRQTERIVMMGLPEVSIDLSQVW